MRKVLVVENDPHQVLLYAEELADEGYSVICAAKGREALEMVERHCPDLVVLDINLPDMDGLEVLEHLLEAQPRLSVVIHTVYATYQDSFTSWCADAYVVRFTTTKDTLLSQKLILQSRFKTSLALQEVEEVTTSSRFSNVELGFRLFYEISRQLAPYIGIYYDRSFGLTATFVRREGSDSAKLRILAGVRMVLKDLSL